MSDLSSLSSRILGARMLLAPMLMLALFAGCSGSGSGSGSTPVQHLVIRTAGLADGTAGTSYSSTLEVSGGQVPYTWRLTSGTLPAGLSLDSSTGIVSGTPQSPASGVSLTFTVTDASSPALSADVTLVLTIMPALQISTASLPSGKVGTAYSATLAATGGTTPYHWALASGTLPAGLSLNATTGVISGAPTTTGASSLTLQVTDSGSPAQSQSTTLSLTVSPSTIVVSVSPIRAALTVTQTLTLNASTNDPAGVNWSISPSGSSGSFNPATSLSGANVTLTAPSAAGVYTITASSITNTAVSASFTLGVTDLASVSTYHNDLARDGANTHEFALTTTNVNASSFGHLFSCPVDGAVYAQPLWVANLAIGNATHNVVFVATQHDGLFAFDADASPCVQLWQVSLIDSNHGGTSGETTVPSGPTGFLVGFGNGDISPEVGVTGTPVIDPSTNTLYVVSKSVKAGPQFYQRLHAIDITTGKEKTGSPMVIAATSSGTANCGAGNSNFSAQQNNQRAGLALVNGTVYVAWASHEDAPPFCGWLIGYSYNGSAFTQNSVLNVAPNTGEGGIWMGGGAPAADSNGHIYVITGNANFDVANNEYGDSFLQLNTSLVITSYFTPSDQAKDRAQDVDFGAGGAAVVLTLPSGPLQHLVIGGGKDGVVYLLNGDNMGGFGDQNSRQLYNTNNPIYSTGAFWNNTFYLVPEVNPALQFAFDTTTNSLNTTPTQSAHSFGFPGSTPSISASGASANGILWALDNTNYCTPATPAPACGPAVLHAFDATNLANELWNSSMASGDAAGNAVKFTVPTVANGKVYVGDRGNNMGGTFGSTSVNGQLDVYGLKPN